MPQPEESPVLLALAKSIAPYGAVAVANAGRRAAATFAGYMLRFEGSKPD
jgi:hypothetical protein